MKLPHQLLQVVEVEEESRKTTRCLFIFSFLVFENDAVSIKHLIQNNVFLDKMKRKIGQKEKEKKLAAYYILLFP